MCIYKAKHAVLKTSRELEENEFLMHSINKTGLFYRRNCFSSFSFQPCHTDQLFQEVTICTVYKRNTSSAQNPFFQL